MIKKGNKIIADKIEYCESFVSKAFGLRFRKKPVNKGMIFSFNTPQKVMMDMLFVFYPIDVIFLDENKKVIEIKEKFMPFSFYNSKKEAKYIIEFENGVINKNNICINDLIVF